MRIFDLHPRPRSYDGKSPHLKTPAAPDTLEETLVTLNPVFTSKTPEGRRLQSAPQDIPYTWLLVENNLGNYEGTFNDPPMECNSTTAGYPNACDWPSISNIKATAPIYASGDYTEWNKTKQLLIPDSGMYMVNVMAEGYRLCGGYFEVNTNVTTTEVRMVCQVRPQARREATTGIKLNDIKTGVSDKSTLSVHAFFPSGSPWSITSPCL
jgi:hypothetical protein